MGIQTGAQGHETLDANKYQSSKGSLHLKVMLIVNKQLRDSDSTTIKIPPLDPSEKDYFFVTICPALGTIHCPNTQ